MKKQGNAETATRIKSLISSIMMGSGLSHEERNALYAELDNIKNGYDLFDTVFENNGKLGVKDIAGNIRVPALYKEFSELYSYTTNRLAPVAAMDFNGKFALVRADGSGEPNSPFEYDMIKYIYGTQYLFACAKDKGDTRVWGLMAGNGKLIVPCEMDRIHGFSNNYMAIEKDGKFGFVTADGICVEPVYDEIEDDGEIIMVRRDGKPGYISSEFGFIAADDEERLENEELLILCDF